MNSARLWLIVYCCGILLFGISANATEAKIEMRYMHHDDTYWIMSPEEYDSILQKAMTALPLASPSKGWMSVKENGSYLLWGGFTISRRYTKSLEEQIHVVNGIIKIQQHEGIPDRHNPCSGKLRKQEYYIDNVGLEMQLVRETAKRRIPLSKWVLKHYVDIGFLSKDEWSAIPDPTGDRKKDVQPAKPIKRSSQIISTQKTDDNYLKKLPLGITFLLGLLIGLFVMFILMRIRKRV